VGKFVKQLSDTQQLWSLGWKLEFRTGNTEYVVTSFGRHMEVTETFVFPADSNGKIISWTELPGSFRGDLDHKKAIRDLELNYLGDGYETT